MKLLPAGALGYNNRGALERAKNYRGRQPHSEFFADCAIMYRDDKAFIVPVPVGGWVPMKLPNPIPYRGLQVKLTDSGYPTLGYTSDGTASSPFFYGSPPLRIRPGNTYPKPGLNIWLTAGTVQYEWAAKWKEEVIVGNTPIASGDWLVETGSYNYDWFRDFGAWAPENPVVSAVIVTSLYAVFGVLDDVPVYVSSGVPYYSMPYHANLNLVRRFESIEAWIADDRAAGTAGKHIRVTASDAIEIAREAQIDVQGLPGYKQQFVGTEVWNGANYVRVFENTAGAYTFHHDFTFTVPEDCIYPENPVPPTAPAGYSQAQWDFDWNAAQVELLLRKKLWLKKNSDAVIEQLKAGTFSLPPSWDYALKANALTSEHTYRPLLPTAEFPVPDVIMSDTSAELTQAGVKVSRRTTTITYTALAVRRDQLPEVPTGVTVEDTDVGSEMVVRKYTQIIDGALTQVVTEHRGGNSYVGYSRADTYLNWYVPLDGQVPSGIESNFAHQFLRDGGTHLGMGLLWNGVVQQGYNPNSTTGTPGSPLNYFGYTPAYPAASNTLAGTAPALILLWHNTVKPTYRKTNGDTAWNDSALMGGEVVNIILYGPMKDEEDLGMFGDTEGAQATAVYGKAVYSYKYETGAFSFVKWVEPTTSTIPFADPESGDRNALVQYLGLQWPDVITAARTDSAERKPPEAPLPDNRTAAQKLQYALITAFS
jgi:hypothetical protein